MTAADVLEKGGGEGIRIFSVDGSHTAEATFADISTAAGSLVPGGIVVIGATNMNTPPAPPAPLFDCFAPRRELSRKAAPP